MTQALARAKPAPSARSRPRLAPAPVAPTEPAAPSWRGVLHEKGFALSPAFGVLLVASAGEGRARVAATVFAVTSTAMLGTSMLCHRTRAAQRWQPWFRRADHLAIGIFIAGTWASIALVGLSGAMRLALTASVCGGALAAALVTIVWVRVPGWIPATVAFSAAWSASAALPQLATSAGLAGTALVVLGGACYSAGAAVYALRNPNAHPAFGYHELFHALVLVGVACHYAALA
jgi:hemolysin III